LDVREKDLPPFRGSYQTSLFHGCLEALGQAPLETAGEPQVYEIGVGKAYDLSSRATPFEHLEGHPGWILVLMLLALILLTPFVPELRRTFFRQSSPPTAKGIVRRLAPLVAWAVILLILVLIWRAGLLPDQEPFALFSGISGWPTVLLRLLAFGLAVAAFLLAYDDVRANDRMITKRYFGSDRSEVVAVEAEDRPPERFLVRVRNALRRLDQKLIVSWSEPGDEVVIRRTWDDYLRLGRSGSRIWRMAPVVVAYVMLCWLVFAVTGKPNTPVRGDLSIAINKIVLVLAGLSLIVLLFLVLDATRLCERFVRNLVDKTIRWPKPVLERWKEKRGLGEEEVRELLFVHLVADRTATITKLIYYPFLIVLIMILSRHGVFDNWSWPIGLVVVFVLHFTAAVASAVILRRSAEEARSSSRRRLKRLLVRLSSDPSRSSDQARIAGVKHTLEEIDGIREGAFATWAQNAVVRAVLIPFGGVGTLALLEAVLR
jgi:hypothetical protein